MGEQTFFNEGGCMITNARFTTAGQTYAMANVTSVKTAQDSIVLALLFFLGGIISLVAQAWLVGLICMGIGGLFIYFRQTHVVLHTAGAEQKALSSRDRNFIARVVQALNDAIVHRG
jgi:hypothetical protein